MDTLYMGRTHSGEKRHLLSYTAIVHALTCYKPAGPSHIPALCGAHIVNEADVVMHDPRFDNTRKWAVPYAAHWDDHNLCRHCRAIEQHRPEFEEVTCSVIGCEVSGYACPAGLYLCEEHRRALGDA